jgi:23S rRNA (uridine2552-2'-O)-methyltransferase
MTQYMSPSPWLRRQQRDPYVIQARERGYRSRAVFKLEQLDRRHRLLRPGMTVVDLGAAPGGWSQYAAGRVGPEGRVVASDLLPMEPIRGVAFIQGDSREQAVLQALLEAMDGRKADLVISDMAPNMSGVRSVDQPRALSLAELALELAQDLLRPGGGFLVKLFQGEGFEAYVGACRVRFAKVVLEKPKASREGNREVYVLGLGGHASAP